MAHWHDFNPWSCKAIYLPDLEELVHCLYPQGRHPVSPFDILAQWQSHKKLDAYLLPQSEGQFLCGLRYGKEPHEYYSPLIDRFIGQLLFDKYTPREAQSQ